MSKKEEQPVDVIQMFEQLNAHATNIAIATGEYYKTLKSNGVPDPLAERLTTEFHIVMWSLGRGPQ